MTRARAWAVGRIAAGVLVVAAIGIGLWAWRTHDAELERRLSATPPGDVANHADLARYAARVARPIYKRECAACHGDDMKGGRTVGAPSLIDDASLYGNGVFSIERRILYGARSGEAKANDLTEMLAYGQRGLLTDSEIRNVTQYVLQLSRRPHDNDAAVAGRVVWNGPAVCGDCHGADGTGNIDYGAPDLTANVWDYGGDPQQIYDSIYYGRHGVMPAWVGKLTPAQIRALALYVHDHAKS